MPDNAASEAALQALQRQLDAARAELQDFTYAVSHDLRAPLRHIDAFAQVIAEDWLDMPTEVAGHLATIQRSAQLLTRQLDGLTALSRLGLQPPDVQAVDVGALAVEVAAQVAARYPQQTMQWQLANAVPAVRADAALLRQVLEQVFDNAVKFSLSGGASPMAHMPQAVPIELTWRALHGGRCQISVRDHGVGFEVAQAAALFKAFGKLHPARDYPGLGLGLVACRKIMTRLNGAIDITGLPGEGCCVSLTLPLA